MTAFSFTSIDKKLNGEIHLGYECDRFGAFTEIAYFAPEVINQYKDDFSFNHLLRLLHIACGVSYYKCAAADHIRLNFIANDDVLAMMKALYQEGLAEFYYRNDLDVNRRIQISTLPAAENFDKNPFSPDPHKAVLAYGGGKDSYVAQSLLERTNFIASPTSVIMSDEVKEKIQQTSKKEVRFLKRKLDLENLRAASEKGAYNGHIPITAINSIMLVIEAYVTQQKYVVFANERSADEPTIVTEELQANHQYSKSSAFELLLRKAFTHCFPFEKVEYFSILRPVSELWIGKYFSTLKDVHQKFTSCNRNFAIAGVHLGKDIHGHEKRWCGNCAKCAFTSLLVGPYLSPLNFQHIFQDDFYNNEKLVPYYKELCGFTENKPWDCVGTIDECRISLLYLATHEDYKDSLFVKELLPQISALPKIDIDAAMHCDDWHVDNAITSKLDLNNIKML